jgi:O-antigen ligase
MASRPIAAPAASPLRLLGLLALLASAVALVAAPPPVALALFGLAVALPLSGIVIAHPEAAVVGLLFVTGGFVPRNAGGLPLDDLAAATILGLVVLYGATGRRIAVRWWPVSGPFLVLFGAACFSALYAVVWKGVPTNLALGELRPTLYGAACILGGTLIIRRSQVVALVAGIFVIADLTTAVVLLQQWVGTNNPLFNAMETSTWQVNSQIDGASAFGAVRIVPPGHVMVYLAALWAFALVLDNRRALRWRLLLAAQFLFLNFGLVLTYTRAQWIASAIAIALMVVFLPRQQKKLLGKYVLAIVPVLLIAGCVMAATPGSAGATLVTALADRASSIFAPDQTLSSASLEWRLFETAAAEASIRSHPWLGVGLGNDYRSMTILQGEARGWLYDLAGTSRLTRFVHNSYLYMTVKMGLPTLGVFAWFALSYLVIGVRTVRRVSSTWSKLLLMPCVFGFAGLLEWAIFEAHFMLSPSMAAIGLSVAMVGAAIHLDRPEPGRAPAPGREVVRVRATHVARSAR